MSTKATAIISMVIATEIGTARVNPSASTPRERRYSTIPPVSNICRPTRLIELLEAPAGARVVDFGTGTGTFALELAGRRPDLEVIALDEQPQMLDILKAKPVTRELHNLKAVLNGEMALAASAERVVAINVLHELGDEALKDLAAMLKPGGSALVVDWNSEVDRPVGPPRDHVYSPVEARRRLEAAGLRASEGQPLKYHYVFVATKP